MRAPAPFEVFTAGMFYGLCDAANGRTVHDYTEDEIRRAFRGWLEKWGAEFDATPEPADVRALCKRWDEDANRGAGEPRD